MAGFVLYSLLLDLKIFKGVSFLKSRLEVAIFFALLAILAWLIILLLRKIGVKRVLFLLFGVIAGRLLSEIVMEVFTKGEPVYLAVFSDIFMIAASVFGFMRLEKNVVFRATFPFFEIPGNHKADSQVRSKVVDTSVVIDGRIADVIDAGFIEGTFIVPEFVLAELQQIADSPDAIKRSRGRRGLDMLSRMKSSPNCTVRISDVDFPQIREVDAKLVELAARTNSMLLTNDFNLNKVAALKGLRVLNINELANALKASVLPGEEMTVTVIKEGKDPNQGIAYLDDGTMIVIDKGRAYINQRVAVMVSSVFQTPAGRMIFAHPIK